MPEETRTIRVIPKNGFECGLNCPYLRRYERIGNGVWWCSADNQELFMDREKELIQRSSRCNGTHLFDMQVSEAGVKFSP
jgi:hypothetical protein